MMRRMLAILAQLAAMVATPTLPAYCPELPLKPIVIDLRPAMLARLELAIARHENCLRWNNPGCLKFAGQPNALRLANGYARFLTGRDGRVALDRDLTAKLRRGLSVGEIVREFNPKYLSAVLRETRLREGDSWSSMIFLGN